MNSQALELAIVLIKRFEGCELEAYKCPAGVWTIGYGETKGVKKGDTWSLEQAETALRARVAEFGTGVLSACPQLAVEPSSRLAACVSLAYNIGLQAFSKSTVCRMLMSKRYKEAGDAFMMWNKVRGSVVNGLTARRETERKVFNNV